MIKKLVFSVTSLLILATLTFTQTTNRGIVAETITERESTLGKPEIKFQTGQSIILGLEFSPNGRYILSFDHFSLILWDLKTGKEIRTFSSTTGGYLYSASFSPDGKYISCVYDDTIKLLEVESGKEIRTLTGHTDYVSSVSFSPDGKYISCVYDDCTVKLLEVESGKEIRTLTGHTDYVSSVSFSPDGKYLASASDDYTVKLWDVDSGKEIRTFEGHTDSVSFSPDGKYLVTNGIALWNIEKNNEEKIFLGDSIYFHSDGKHITVHDGQKIEVWEIESETLKNSFSLDYLF